MRYRCPSLRFTPAAVLAAVLLSAPLLSAPCALAQDKSASPLPQKSDIPGITPQILVKTTVPGAPWKQEIVTRTTYEPGARIRKHYHPSQIVFVIIEGSMLVQEEGKPPVTLKAGDALLIPPGTIHEHANASQTEKLVFAEFVLVDDGQRSAVFTEPAK